jgi:DNA-binding MarR family transcriptional regulator
VPPRRVDFDGLSLGGLNGLDRLLEHRARLGICILLYRGERLTFSRLKAILEETDGSLGAHLQKLEEGGYISVRKEFQARKPVSWYALTRDGRAALQAHLKALTKLITEATTAT